MERDNNKPSYPNLKHTPDSFTSMTECKHQDITPQPQMKTSAPGCLLTIQKETHDLELELKQISELEQENKDRFHKKKLVLPAREQSDKKVNKNNLNFVNELEDGWNKLNNETNQFKMCTDDLYCIRNSDKKVDSSGNKTGKKNDLE